MTRRDGEALEAGGVNVNNDSPLSPRQLLQVGEPQGRTASPAAPLPLLLFKRP
ncbi:MAG: hypothetical protein IGS49_21685 [Chlorogloeopsis fritschii C42_A2020_084]|uniref:hypothetical protein n=1 Tax=Chlorogloeopsis fritschii TaxID=1124 RepID=UPI0019E7E927|nr:hypothetical protein [Chlorogloeopsis fritschii]MBF2007980.1 hypothetical protein [Chlorogloeopsis fritschii C42_A2020_084]